MRTVNRIVTNGRNKTIEEYLVFDDLEEYLKWYLEETKNYRGEGATSFMRRGYNEWKSLEIEGQKYYSLYVNDYEKVTKKLLDELLEYANKTYSVSINDHPYYAHQNHLKFSGSCNTIEEAVEVSKKMAQESIRIYRKEIDELLRKINVLENLEHKSLLKTEYLVVYPKETK